MKRGEYMANDQNRISVDITDHSEEVKEALDEKIETILTMLGIQAEKHAKEGITNQGAIDTGLLRNSITWAIGGKRANIREYRADRGEKQGSYTETAEKRQNPCVFVGTNVEYAAYVEMGTSKMRPRPYLKPAVVNYKDEYKAIVESVLKGENG